MFRVTSTLKWSCGAEQVKSRVVGAGSFSRTDQLQFLWRPDPVQTWQPLSTWKLEILMLVPRSGVMVRVRAPVGWGSQEGTDQRTYTRS